MDWHPAKRMAPEYEFKTNSATFANTASGLPRSPQSAEHALPSVIFQSSERRRPRILNRAAPLQATKPGQHAKSPGFVSPSGEQLSEPQATTVESDTLSEAHDL